MAGNSAAWRANSFSYRFGVRVGLWPWAAAPCQAALHFGINRRTVEKMLKHSVPPGYRRSNAHRDILVRGYVHEVLISCGTEIIARHRRSYERGDMIFDPVHYLALLEKKIGALDQAAPLSGWELPEAFARLRRLLERRMGKAGKREYVQVLRLLETFEIDDVHVAIKRALELGAIGYDAVKHLVLCRIERRPPRLDLDIYPYLPKARVGTTSVCSYMSLLGAAP